MKRDYERQVTQLTESLKDMQNQMMKALDNADEEKRHHEEQVRKLQDQIAATRQRADQAENRNHGTASDYDQLSKEYKTIERKWREASTQLADVSTACCFIVVRCVILACRSEDRLKI